VAIVQGGNCPGGNCPGGNCPVTHFLVLKKHIKHVVSNCIRLQASLFSSKIPLKNHPAVS